jgi:hypothetical protein
MKKILTIFFIHFFIAGCTNEGSGILIGYNTRLMLEKEDLLIIPERQQEFFRSFLQADPLTHFSGKVFLDFDTIYTSTIKRNVATDPAAMLKADTLVKIYQVHARQTPFAIFYSKQGRFIYRTFFPEPAHQQTIIVDVAGFDSAVVRSYFNELKIQSLVKQ